MLVVRQPAGSVVRGDLHEVVRLSDCARPLHRGGSSGDGRHRVRGRAGPV